MKAVEERDDYSMVKFGVVKDLATNDLEKIYGTVRLEGSGWYIEVAPTGDMRGLEIRCSGNTEGSSAMIVRPHVTNVIHVSSRASENL
jgi:hypothetical protein